MTMTKLTHWTWPKKYYFLALLASLLYKEKKTSKKLADVELLFLQLDLNGTFENKLSKNLG